MVQSVGLGIQVPDFGRSLAQGFQLRAASEQMEGQNALRAMLAQPGVTQGLLAGDPNILARIAGIGPQGLQVALPVQQQAQARADRSRERDEDVARWEAEQQFKREQAARAAAANRPAFTYQVGEDGQVYALDPRNPTAAPIPTGFRPQSEPRAPRNVQTVTMIDPETQRPAIFALNPDGTPGNKIGDAPDRNEGNDRGFQQATTLRQNFAALPAVKDYEAVSNNFRAMIDAAPRENNAADLNMVFAFAKMLDPASVVREGEAQSIARTDGIFGQLQGYLMGLRGGGRLTPDVRQQLIGEAAGRYAIARENYEAQAQRFTEIATRAQLDPADVVTARARVQPPARPRRMTQAEFEAAPSGTLFEAPDGTIRRKP